MNLSSNIRLAIISLLTISSIAHAEIPGYRKVSAEQNQAYIDAIVAANGSRIIGTECSVESSDTVNIQENSAQPLIILERELGTNKGDRIARIIITSDAK